MIRQDLPILVTRAAGFTMIEVLITIFILAIGLLGAAALQPRIYLAEIEAFQRAQSIMLLEDMKARINANRKQAMSYVTTTPEGTGNSIEDCSSATGATLDLCQWNNALLGAAESSGSTRSGAMIGARGCINNTVPTMPRQFVISVVWQGVNPTLAPTSTACGSGLYGAEANRRAVTATVIIGCLQNDPTTGLCVTP
jgi:type IV pilus assembly protein PilV